MLPPAHATRLPARRLHRAVIPTAVTCALVATALSTLAAPAESASAAAVGTYTIGTTPIALNQATDPGIGTLTPTADAADNGMFGPQTDWPLLPLHAALTRNGHVVSYGSPLGGSAQNGSAFDDWDPTTNAHIDTASMHAYDSFCNSAVTLLDGRLLMVAGQYNTPTSSEASTMLYDPVTRTQDMGADLAYKRWYVTSLRLTDGRILLLGGGDAGNTQTYTNPDANAGVATTPEIGTGTGAWTKLTGAESTILFGAKDNHWWYPRAFNAPSGGVVGFSGNLIWTLSTAGTGSTKVVGQLPFNPRVSGSQVMYAPGKILVAGGGQNEQADGVTANDDAAVVDVSTANPTVTRTASMAHRRNWLNLTVLPTGEVLANGGTVVGTAAGEGNSVKQTEIWNPATGAWRTAASAQRTRTYHQTALVLPSGAVLTAGGGGATYTGSGAAFGPENNLNAEVYYPSYLFAKSATGAVTWASRPGITAISGTGTYGGTVDLTMGDTRKIASASLINVGVVTHDQNTDQRRIPLDITQQGGTVTATLPDSVNTLPQGDYELTVVDAKGVPSTAQIITMRQGQRAQVTVGAGTEYAAPADGGTTTGAGGAAGGGAAGGATGGTPAGGGTATAAPAKAATLVKGSTIGLASASKAGYRVSHTGTKATVKKAGTTSSRTARKATSWIVRAGVGSKTGYSLESVDKKGYYLAAPSDGTGAATLVKRSSSASFAKRATFTAVQGTTAAGITLRLTAKPGNALRVSGSKLVAGSIGTSAAKAKAATFTASKGLAKR